MKRAWLRIGVAGGCLALAACSQEALWPSLSAPEPGTRTAAQVAQAQAAQAQAAPSVAPGFAQPATPSGPPTGTFVGQKAAELRQELERLKASVAQHNDQLQAVRASIVQDSQRYHAGVAGINARLQVGTTPGNPVLVQQFDGAQSALEQLNESIARMNTLTTAVAADSTLAAYLAESVRAAFRISGALDEDHLRLAQIQDEVNRTVVLVERLNRELTEDLRRQTQYVATERSNLNLLASGVKSGEIYGASLINQAMLSAAGVIDGQQHQVGAADITGRRPLVVIRFDSPDIAYQQALYNAVSRALERRPTATFDLVAVAPTGGGTAQVAINSTKVRQDAEAVLRSLVEMGLPPTRVAVSSTTSPAARTNEVHLYLR